MPLNREKKESEENAFLKKKIEILDLGRINYSEALSFQKKRLYSRIDNIVEDTLLFAEHFPVITLGLRGTEKDILLPQEEVEKRNVTIIKVGRGGMATFHGLGQLVCYPIIKLKKISLPVFVDKILNAIEASLKYYNLEPQRNVHGYGMWVNDAKIASIGLALKKWTTFHGVALNVNTDLSYFNMISPCGNPKEKITSIKQELGREVDYNEVKEIFKQAFAHEFNYDIIEENKEKKALRRPHWLKLNLLNTKQIQPMEKIIKEYSLHTVCQEALCPNKSECFSHGTSTFIIMGDICTRNCQYCAVMKGKPKELDRSEPENVAYAVEKLSLNHAVVTSVTRDDIEDGGAEHFAKTIHAIKKISPQTSVEVLVPDFNGNEKALQILCSAKPDMFNHNIETVKRLFSLVRPIANYELSLEVLLYAHKQGLKVKSGIMLGLGETWEETRQTIKDLYNNGCRYLTLGQYLAPSKNHAPIARFIAPDEFEHWKEVALEMGFLGVASSPLVRSSYRAENMMKSS